METPSNTFSPARAETAIAMARPQTKGLRHSLPLSHHLDKRVDGILSASQGHPDDLLNSKQLADWLGVSKSWVDNARSKKIGPAPIELNKRLIVYKRSDVLAWLESRRRKYDVDGK